MSVGRRLREVVLTLGAVLGVVCLASLVAMVGFGVRPLIVRSGSMEPSIATGALALARSEPVGQVEVGDVVSVTHPSGARVTHRVVAIDRDGRGYKLTLQGDANRTPDAEPYVVSRVDRVLADVPVAGRVVAWTAGPVGRFVLGISVGLVLLLALGGRRAPARVGVAAAPTVPPRHSVTVPPRPPRVVGRFRRRLRRGVRWTVRLAAAGCVAAAAIVVPASPSHAAYADSATLSGGAFAAYTVPAPVISSCTVSGSIFAWNAHIVWSGVMSPFELGYTATLVDTGATLTVGSSGTDRYVDVGSGLLGSLLGHDITIRLQARLTTTPSWTSPTTSQQLRVGLLGLSLKCL